MMIVSPMVTVVITTYKRLPQMVERAINSVVNQTYKNIELIVVDDSPETYQLRNEVKEKVETYKNAIYIQHEKNKGACVARNTGLNLAQGKYIAYLDDDDEWMPTKIEKQVQRFTNDEIALVYCGYKVYYDDKSNAVDVECKAYEGDLYEKLLMEGNFIGSTSFVLMNKEYLDNIGGFDPLMESAQDADVWLRLAKKYKVASIKEALVIYHIHEGERITSNFTRKINGITRLIEKNKEAVNANKQISSRYYRELALLYASDGQLAEAFKKWNIAIKHTPCLLMKNYICLCQIFISYFRCVF